MKYLAVDFGLKKIGLAISDGIFSSPWKVVKVKNMDDCVRKINKILHEERFDKLIVGKPEGKLSKLIGRFVKNLKDKGAEVEIVDETLSSQKALRLMIEMGFSKKKRRTEDSFAAAEILQNFLDSNK